MTAQSKLWYKYSMGQDYGEQAETGGMRTVHCADALDWLKANELPARAALIASIPDVSEFSGSSLSDWQQWFGLAAERCLVATPADGVTVFFQSDIRYEGIWVDKGYLCLRAAERCAVPLLWHRIACRVRPGVATAGRAGFSHMLCFSRGWRPSADVRGVDVLPEVGEKVWERGMGYSACEALGVFCRSAHGSSVVVNPFCGRGSMLAMANSLGLPAVGIERSPKRARLARRLRVEHESRGWKLSEEDASVS